MPVLRETDKDQVKAFELLISSVTTFEYAINKALEKVLDTMLDNNLTQENDRRAVWHYFTRIYGSSREESIKEKIGKTFPSEAFEDGCCFFCKEKVWRTIINALICSHENRNPKKKEWGGSINIVFNLVAADNNEFIIQYAGAPSGLKEWEDLALELGSLYYLGLIKFKDPQVQEILHRAEKSVTDDPEAQPKGISISQYVKLVFNAIDDAL